MHIPAVFDLHCDTLTAFLDAPSPAGERDTLDLPGHHFALSKLRPGCAGASAAPSSSPTNCGGRRRLPTTSATGTASPADGAVF